MSATPDSTLANPDQRIADLERQLAECRAERDEYKAARDEALEQQTATAEVLGVINSSPGDLAPVFDALLDRALRLCQASYGTLLTWDGERLHRSAFRGASVELMEALGGSEPVIPVPGSVADRLLRGKSTIHTADLTRDPSFASPRVQTLGRVGGVRSYISVPLRKDGRFLGFISIYRREVRPFSDKQIALLENFAAQAVIAIENARLINETREALEQQTATTEVLQVINSSPGDLAPVFDVMLEKAMRLCDAAYGHLYTFDGERFHPTAMRGEPRVVEWFRQFGPIQPAVSSSPLARILRQRERVVCYADVMQEEAYHELTGFRELVDMGGIRSLATVALTKEDTLLGTIGVYRREVRPFSDKEIALLQNFAARAVIAMENARLLTETREALEQQTATAEVLGVINSSPGDLAPVFDAMLDKAMSLCEAASGVLMTYDGEYLHAVSWRGVPEVFYDYLRKPVRPAPGNTVFRLLQGEEVVHIADLREDADNRYGDAARRAIIDLGGARTLVLVPLRKDGKLVGTIRVYRQEVRPFTDKQIALLQNFAAQAVIAMENARLLTETREALEQ